MKTALITGITGQDGAYLAEFLLAKGYEVHGIKRRASSFNTQRIDHLFHDQHESGLPFHLHYGDLTDGNSLISVVEKAQPDEIYNLGAQSHVKVSFDQPHYTAQVDGIGTLCMLEAIRVLKMTDKVRFYQASTSELFGKIEESPQNENTPFYPRSPYGVAKMYGYWITVNYREAYGMFACNGILFNHESPIRGETFVTRKITRAAARIEVGLQEHLYLGNLNALRDWGHARDFVEGMWLMVQQDEPDDFVLATGEQHSVREFVEISFARLGTTIEWRGEGEAEQGFNQETGKALVSIDPMYYRPAEVETLLGDASKARDVLGWEPTVTFKELVEEMVDSDLELAKRDKLMKEEGFKLYASVEDRQ